MDKDVIDKLVDEAFKVVLIAALVIGGIVGAIAGAIGYYFGNL